jgi:hypothetical protein
MNPEFKAPLYIAWERGPVLELTRPLARCCRAGCHPTRKAAFGVGLAGLLSSWRDRLCAIRVIPTCLLNSPASAHYRTRA